MHNINVQNLIQKLSDNLNLYKVVKYEIVENFQKNGERTYQLHNLLAEFEDDMVFFGDRDRILSMDVSYVLNGFLIGSIINIIVEEDIIEIYLKDGYIIINIVR